MGIGKYILLRVYRWLHDTMIVMGILASGLFFWVNVCSQQVTVHIPDTPLFVWGKVVKNEQLDEYLAATKPLPEPDKQKYARK